MAGGRSTHAPPATLARPCRVSGLCRAGLGSATLGGTGLRATALRRTRLGAAVLRCTWLGLAALAGTRRGSAAASRLIGHCSAGGCIRRCFGFLGTGGGGHGKAAHHGEHRSEFGFLHGLDPLIRTRDVSPFVLPRPQDSRSPTGQSRPAERGGGTSDHDHDGPCSRMVQRPHAIIRRRRAVGYTGAESFSGAPEGAASFGGRPEGRRGPGRRGGGGFAGHARLSRCRGQGNGAVRRATRRVRRSRHRARCERCGSSSSR